MDFATAAQKTAYEKSREGTKELLGDFSHERPDVPIIDIIFGSVSGLVSVHPWRDDSACAVIMIGVARGIEVTEDMAKYLLQENFNLAFGSFAIAEKGLFLVQQVPGARCSKDEFKVILGTMLSAAVHYDRELRQSWPSVILTTT